MSTSMMTADQARAHDSENMYGLKPRDSAERKRMAWMLGQIEILLEARRFGARLTGAAMSACWKMLSPYSNRELSIMFDRVLNSRDKWLLAQPISAVILRDEADRVRKDIALRARYTPPETRPERLLPDPFDASDQGQRYRDNMAQGMSPPDALREALRNAQGPLADLVGEAYKQTEKTPA